MPEEAGRLPDRQRPFLHLRIDRQAAVRRVADRKPGTPMGKAWADALDAGISDGMAKAAGENLLRRTGLLEELKTAEPLYRAISLMYTVAMPLAALRLMNGYIDLSIMPLEMYPLLTLGTAAVQKYVTGAPLELGRKRWSLSPFPVAPDRYAFARALIAGLQIVHYQERPV